MIKRIVLAYLDLRAVVNLWLAEIRHDGAVRTANDAEKELARALGYAEATEVGLSVAQVNARHAAMHVRRHRERMAMGL